MWAARYGTSRYYAATVCYSTLIIDAAHPCSYACHEYNELMLWDT